jgi:hypothetical protein
MLGAYKALRRKMNPIVKIILKISGVLLVLAGGVWALQGLDLLPGTFMRGDPQWIINGAIVVLIGIGLYWTADRRK